MTRHFPENPSWVDKCGKVVKVIPHLSHPKIEHEQPKCKMQISFQTDHQRAFDCALLHASCQSSNCQLNLPSVSFAEKDIATAVKAHPNFCSSARLEYAIPWRNKNHKDFSGQDSFHDFMVHFMDQGSKPRCSWSSFKHGASQIVIGPTHGVLKFRKKRNSLWKTTTEIQNLQKEMTSLNIKKKFCPVAFYQAWTSWRSNPSRQKEVYPWKHWASKYFNIGLLHLLQEEYSKSCLTSHQQISQKGFLYRNSPNLKQYKKRSLTAQYTLSKHSTKLTSEWLGSWAPQSPSWFCGVPNQSLAKASKTPSEFFANPEIFEPFQIQNDKKINKGQGTCPTKA